MKSRILVQLLGLTVFCSGLALRVYSMHAMKLYLMILGWIMVALLFWAGRVVWRNSDGSTRERARSMRVFALLFVGSGLYAAYILFKIWQVEKAWAVPLLRSLL